MTGIPVESQTLIKSILATAAIDKNGIYKLPPERVLAEQMGVQRSIIRNALSSLEFFGFIERNQGSGTYIRMPRFSFANLYFDIATQLGYISLDTIEDAREMFERMLAEEAATHATEEEITELRHQSERMVEAETFEEKVEADYQFHLILAGMTHNPVIMLFYQSIASFISDLLRKRRSIMKDMDESKTRINSNHKDIVQAIAVRDPEAARAAMRAHFSHWERENMLISLLMKQR
ncbi:FCD domain-containing protein [Pantoea dispersa]|uniref:FadR/GntR family transcriptional regulator n=1 Tax=Pantoea dispersa TaxID=59814 RepID=UPI002DB754B4|nr:FCD domain-containing protein [Pantoea dispersa]MEB5837513.1 FCD domain-containing protein [Pantoea dispersa]